MWSGVDPKQDPRKESQMGPAGPHCAPGQVPGPLAQAESEDMHIGAMLGPFGTLFRLMWASHWDPPGFIFELFDDHL